MIKVDHEDNGKQGRIVIYESGVFAGKMTYTWTAKSELTIEHTSVEADFTGKGFGRKLLLEAVNYARGKKAKIVARCSYAKTILDSDDTYKDVRG